LWINLEIISYSGGQIWIEILVAIMDGHENKKTMWWEPRGLLEVRIIKPRQDGKNWNDPCWMFRSPLGRGVAKAGGVVALLSLFISFVVLEDLHYNSKELQQRHFNLHWRKEFRSFSPSTFPFPWKCFSTSHLQHVFLQSLQESPWKTTQCSPSTEYLGWGCCLSNN